jgi:hypothetical protein
MDSTSDPQVVSRVSINATDFLKTVPPFITQHGSDDDKRLADEALRIRVPKISHSVRGQLWHRLAEIGVENQNIFQRLSIKAQCCRRRRSRVQRGKAAGEADIQRSIFFA